MIRRPLLGLLVVAVGGCSSLLVATQGPALRRQVEVLRGPGGERLRVDGQLGRALHAVSFDRLRFSADGRHFAVPVERRRGEAALLRDGTVGPPSPPILDLALSADGARLATVLHRDGRAEVQLDGRSAPPWDEVGRHTLAFTGDGRLRFVGRREGGTHLVVSGTAGPRWDGVGELREEPGGHRLAYLARRGPQGFLVVVDGERHQPRGPFDAIAELAWSSRGELGALVRERGLWSAIRWGDDPAAPSWRSAAYESASDLAFTADGANLFFIAHRRGLQHVVVDGAEQLGADLIVRGSLTARGRRIAYVARFGAASRVLVDGQFGPPHDEVRDLALAPGGHHFAYLAVDRGAWRLWIDGAEQPPIDQAHSLGIDDQGRVALVHRQWTQERIASPAGAARFDVVLERSLVLSDDGRHFACLAGDRRGERFFIAVDGEARYPLAPGLLGRLFQRSIPELLVGTPDPFAAARTLVAAVLARHLEAAPAPR